MSAVEARRIFNSGFDKTASAEKHYTSQQAESSMSQKSTLRTTRTSTRRRHIIPLTFSTSLSQHISTPCPRGNDEIPVCPAINRRGNPPRERERGRGCIPKGICLHLSEVASAEQQSLDSKAAGWLRTEESISKGQQV